MLVQEFECRIAALYSRLSQQESAAVGQQVRSDLLQRLSHTASEASDLHHQEGILESSPMV